MSIRKRFIFIHKLYHRAHSLRDNCHIMVKDISRESINLVRRTERQSESDTGIAGTTLVIQLRNHTGR